MLIPKKIIFKLISLYPAFLGAGIKVKVSADVKTVTAGIKLRFWNRNYVGTQYGGTMCSMCDAPFFLLLVENLGPDYIVWDRSASIYFKKPGKGDVFARFFIPEETYSSIQRDLETAPSINRDFSADITDWAGEVIATVTKTVYLKKKMNKQNPLKS